MKNIILNIDPVAISIGPINIYWYGIAYMLGMLLGLYYAKKIVNKQKINSDLSIDQRDIDEIFLWIVVGIILGSRIGYALFYNIDFYIANPISIFALWKGGMSFHGGVIGVLVAIISYSYRMM